MTTFQSQSVLSEIKDDQPIPLKIRQYFRRLLQNRLHELVLEAFAEQEEKEGLTQKQLAGRLEKDPAQISRWLFTAGNWEFDTFADLLLGMAVRLNELSVTRIAELLPIVVAVEAGRVEPQRNVVPLITTLTTNRAQQSPSPNVADRNNPPPPRMSFGAPL